MSLPLKELISYGQTQLENAGIEDAARDARGLYCFLDKLDNVGLMMHSRTINARLILNLSAGEPEESHFNI